MRTILNKPFGNMSVPNYSGTYNESEVANFLQVDKTEITRWADLFHEYLSPAANPEKEKIQRFNSKDLDTLAYIYMYWEDDPDIDSIKLGLNYHSHFDYIFIPLSEEVKTIIREITDEIAEGQNNGSFTGKMIVEPDDLHFLAHSYKRAGDILISTAMKDTARETEITYPIIFNYRHAVELWLKANIPNPKRIHKLIPLYLKFKKRIYDENQTDVPIWLENLVATIHHFDSNGITFRYKTKLPEEEMVLDLRHMRKIMKKAQEYFEALNI